MIAFFGFYDDFARYFYKVNTALARYNINSFMFSNNFSGWLYWFLRGKSTCLLPIASFFQNFLFFSKTNKLLTNDDLNFMIEYHQKLLKGKYVFYLRIKARLYFCYLYRWAKNNDINLFFISGDSRLISRSAIVVANKLNIKKLFFEQGPYNTTIIDNLGVNCNFSFRKNFPVFRKNNQAYFDFQSKNKKFKRNKIYRLSDYIFSAFLPLFLFPESTDSVLKIFKNLTLKNNKNAENTEKNKPYILLILQVPDDANMVLHCPLFSSFYDITKNIKKALPNDINLILREHPLYKGSYEKKLYDFVENDPTIMIDNSSSLDEMIKESSLVILNNSTVAFNVIRHKKPLLILGDAYFDNLDFVHKLNSKKYLKSIIAKSLNTKIQKKYIDNFYIVLSSYLTTSHFRDKDITNLALSTALRIKDELL